MALPAASVSAAHPVPLPLDFDYVSDHSLYSKVVFRVYDASSFSPLICSGDQATSGFSSLSRNLGCLNLTALESGDGDIPEDEKSPWISTTKSLTWAVWEIARRLSVQKLEKPKSRPGVEPTVRMSVIKHRSGNVGLSDPRRAYLEAHVDATSPVANALRGARPGEFSHSMRRQCEQALRESRRSKEVLYYGRIFAESIDNETTWTVDRSGLALPAYFFRSPESPSSSRLIGRDGEDS
ncbi:hypothetical protein BD324DRAFT_652266 [Kockovaella imperatae]|uniref:Uncharacterized protein n=1 Tax=Kockovaella imperatae TaxID=4999 RepID=A0A1Y1UCJ4_9TREE|nr:hypothetical protein BD324DRAFT_652266 [Kockovaella imperatae]ORX35722.1 hypothetical protein BD324DRAFT_652266 [Kockovaella imperatae]